MGITRSELVTLKGNIKSEMNRRNGLGPASGKKWTPTRAYGSMTQYAGTAYDFSHSPTKDGRIYSEYGQKTIDLLLKVKSYTSCVPGIQNLPLSGRFVISV